MKKQPVVITGRIKLRHFDPDYCDQREKAGTKERTEELGRKIGDLQQLLYANSSHAVLLIFQGMDASGKDGSVRSVLHYVNPAGVETANFKVPSAEESAHDFLWRIHKAVPRHGNIGVFNRSHYEAVLAERVLGLVPTKVWQARYGRSWISNACWWKTAWSCSSSTCTSAGTSRPQRFRSGWPIPRRTGNFPTRT